MKKFEYKMELDVDIRDLNELGLEGWELVNIFPFNPQKILRDDYDKNWYVMKRLIK